MNTVIDSRRLNSTDRNINPSNPDPAWLALVADKVQNMQYGIIQIVVHDSRVVQIERTERTRFGV